MPDYSKSKIYQIISSQCEQVYIGSTTVGLAQRLAQHRYSYQYFKAGKNKCSSTSYQLLDYDDVKIELIEDFPCERREQLLKREGELIRERNCVNKQIVGRTVKEYREANKERIQFYRYSHKEQAKLYQKAYREAHREKNKAYKKAYYEQKKAERLTSQSLPEQNPSSPNFEVLD